MDPARLENVENRCRLIYFNTRLRTQARPEMLERADGLATTYAQCEKLTVDGWSLLKPMLYTVRSSSLPVFLPSTADSFFLVEQDVEAQKNYRRYVSIQTSTPHRRRAKPKPGAPPKPEPDEEPVDKEVSGFFLVEHDFEKGAIYVAVMMPWAVRPLFPLLSLFVADPCFVTDRWRRLRRNNSSHRPNDQAHPL
jgi:hypothetical protein